MQDVLLLNADYRPVQIMSWERAVCLLLSDKVRTVVSYTDKMIRSENLEIAWPSVVSLVRFARVKTGPRLNRRNVLARDGFRCAYCEDAPALGLLTMDHVVPRSKATQGRVQQNGVWVPVTSWENLVTACAPCNQRKADRTPEQAGMALKQRPRRPNSADLMRIALSRANVPPEWLEYI